MAVTITQQPPRFAFSRNSIIVAATSSKYVEQLALPGYYSITFNAVPTINQTIAFEWFENSQEFTVAAAPNDTGNELPNGGASASAWLANAFPYFQQNYELTKSYKLEISGAELRLSPRVILETEDLQISGTINFTQNNSNNPQAPQYNSAIFLYCRPVFLDNAGNETLLPPIVSSLDENGYAEFNIEKVLDSYLNQVSIAQLYGLTKYSDVPGIYSRVYCKFSEFDSANNEYYASVNSNTFTVQRGGVQISESQNFVSTSNDQIIPLTWLRNKEVLRSQPEWLFFTINSSGGAWQVREEVDVHLVDTNTGNTSVQNYPGSYQSVEILKPIIVPQSIQSTAFVLEVGTTVISKIVATYYFKKDGVDFNDTIQQTWSLVDDKWSQHIWLYENSFGVPQTFKTYARQIHKTVITKEVFEAQLPRVPNAETRQFSTYNENYQDEILATSDDLSQKEMHLLKAALLHDYLYLFNPPYGYLAYYVAKFSPKTGDENKNVNTLQFTAKKAVREENVSARYV